MGLPGRMMLGIAERVAAAAFLCVFLGGCASVNSMLGGNSEALAALQWSPAKEAIVIDIAADPDLNLHDGQPHTMVLAITQSSDPNAFLTLIGDAERSRQALQAGKATGLAKFERIVVKPESKNLVRIDRAEGGKFVGLLAYYNEAKPPANARLFRVPTKVESEGIVVRHRTAHALPLNLQVRLGSSAIAESKYVEPQRRIFGQPEPPPEKPLSKDGVISPQEMQDAISSAARAAQRLGQ
jgi:type VI secretion system VasD/TssJ family lipoprotein